MWVKTIACNHAYKPKSTVIACFLCPLPLVMLAWLHYSDIWAGCHYSSLGILIWLTIPDSEGPGSAFFPLLYTTLFFYSVQSHLACHVIHCDNPKDSIDKSLPRLVGEKKIKIPFLVVNVYQPESYTHPMTLWWCVHSYKSIVGCCWQFRFVFI